MKKVLTLEERWGMQREKERVEQARVIEVAFRPGADPIEQLYTNVTPVLCYGTSFEQHATLDRVGVPRYLDVSDN